MRILEQLRELSKVRYVCAYSLATVYIGLGDKEEALYWLEKGYRERAGGQLARIKVDPFLDPLRGDPRFEALADKVIPGISALARESGLSDETARQPD